MGNVHFLEHYRYHRFIRTIQGSGTFPPCPFHPFSMNNVIDFLNHFHKQEIPVKQIIRIWEVLSLFSNFYHQQPIQMPLEMFTPYDYSKYVNDFLPIYKKRAKKDYDFSIRYFDHLIAFFRFIHERKELGTIEPIVAARAQIYQDGIINRIPRKQLQGPEWALVIPFPEQGDRLVITFNDLWLLVAQECHFHGNADEMRRYLDDPENSIRDRLQKRAHFARLSATLIRRSLIPKKFIRGLLSRTTLEQAKEWLDSRPYRVKLI